VLRQGRHARNRDRRNLVLGSSIPGTPRGRIALDAAGGARGRRRVAARLGTTPLRAAEGISKVVNTNMAEGIRSSRPPRRGPAGSRWSPSAGPPLHVTRSAPARDHRVIVPSVAAVLSAWGMLATDLRYEMVRSHVGEVGA